MTFRSYSITFICLTFFLIIFTISINLYLNEFGLFGNVKGKEYRVYSMEKTSKYLFSYNYIPSNFDGILIGPSLSDQMMDTRKIKNHKIYNLSMDGGNVSELKFAVDNVLKYGDISTLVICLDPYITKNSGRKSSEINEKEYFATLGSLSTVKFYLRRLRNLKKKGNEDVFFDSYWGYKDTEYVKRDKNSTLNINKSLESLNDRSFDIDSLKIDKRAYIELKEIIDNARKKDIRIVAYYYPKPKRIFEHPLYNKEYLKYRKEIDKLLNYNTDTVIDFATDKYNYIRDNDNSYSDGAHLSRDGANEILKVLDYSINN